MKQGSKLKRFPLVGRQAGAAALFVLLLLPLSSLARADSSNLLPNGSFQSGTSGWTTSNAALTIASDGAGDSYAGRVALNATATSYQLTAKPRPVLNTSAGLVYAANGVVRSDTPERNRLILGKPDGSEPDILSAFTVLTSRAGYPSAVTIRIRDEMWPKLMTHSCRPPICKACATG
jgi:hypothetical protein